MKIVLRIVLTVFWIVSIQITSQAQAYSLKVTPSTFTIADSSLNGYSTRFHLPYPEVKKKWWRYIKQKAHIFNYKTHYLLTVPSVRRESNTSFQFISKLSEEQNPLLMVALLKEDMSNEQTQKLNADLKNLLVDFKINYFTERIQEKISRQEKENQKTSKRLHREKNQSSHNAQLLLSKLSQGEQKLKELKEEINKIK